MRSAEEWRWELVAGSPDDVETIKAIQRDALEAARRIVRDAWMVPPDGGSPTKGETDVCDRAEVGIYELILKLWGETLLDRESRLCLELGNPQSKSVPGPD